MMRDHICVCICTYKRPVLLERLLDGLQCQETGGLFTYSAVIVDNDRCRSAEGLVRRFRSSAAFPVAYFCEPEQNIALARNKAVENAQGDFIAFIDDDEAPAPRWLLELYSAMMRFNADAVLGPVMPHFEGTPPEWLIKSRLCELPSHTTGTVLQWRQTRTGNVLFKTGISKDEENRFDRRLGKSGGEDIEFFRIIAQKGAVFVWCAEAPVFEMVPPERWKRSYYLRRNVRTGGIAGEWVREGPVRYYLYFVKYAAGVAVLSVVLPFCLFLGDHLFMKYLAKLHYYAGWVSGFLGYVIMRERVEK